MVKNTSKMADTGNHKLTLGTDGESSSSLNSSQPSGPGSGSHSVSVIVPVSETPLSLSSSKADDLETINNNPRTENEKFSVKPDEEAPNHVNETVPLSDSDISSTELTLMDNNQNQHDKNIINKTKAVESLKQQEDTKVNQSNKGSLRNNKSKGQSGGPKRGISFPKDTFISGYFEPPDPWKNAPLWTTDELISAYKHSCEAHGTKPITKLLQQLHTVAAPGKREEVLTLRGEKLDTRQCESLEEVLRRVQFKLIDLEASHLDDECAVALFDMIEYYESACQLNISMNKNIGARGWQACSRLVRRTPTLTYLDIRSCDMTERNIPIFGRALKMGCHLTILHMESMSLSGRALIILVAAVKNNETLQELFLAENKLVPTDGVHLCSLLRTNHKLNLLDLRNNHLQDVGTSHICDGLMEQKNGHGLRTLVLWNNQISYQAMPVLGQALGASENLETLNIGHNSITNEGVHLLKDGLLKTTSLLRLGLQGTKISDEGAVALAEFIADSTILLRIDLRENDIKTGGLMALSHAMRVNTSVTRIDLDKDTKKESCMKDYAEQQSRLQRDILTCQQRNVQTAIEREEQERERLEKMAIEAEAARKEAMEAAAAAKNESFTVINADEVAEKGENQEKGENAEREESKMDTEREGENVEEGKDENSGEVEEKEETKDSSSRENADGEASEELADHVGPDRPTLLFSQPQLQAQESLDSPNPTPDDIHSSPKASLSVNHPSLPLKMPDKRQAVASTPPAEMLLSPQYYPKQLARKIFSVSRVDEQVCSSPSSHLLHPLAMGLETVDVAEMSSSTPLCEESIKDPSSCDSGMDTTGGKSAESIRSNAISPNSLFRDLEDETVKLFVTEENSTAMSSSPFSAAADLDSSPSPEATVVSGCKDMAATVPTSHSSSSSTASSVLYDDVKNCDNSNPSFKTINPEPSENSISSHSNTLDEGACGDPVVTDKKCTALSEVAPDVFSECPPARQAETLRCESDHQQLGKTQMKPIHNNSEKPSNISSESSHVGSGQPSECLSEEIIPSKEGVAKVSSHQGDGDSISVSKQIPGGEDSVTPVTLKSSLDSTEPTVGDARVLTFPMSDSLLELNPESSSGASRTIDTVLEKPPASEGAFSGSQSGELNRESNTVAQRLASELFSELEVSTGNDPTDVDLEEEPWLAVGGESDVNDTTVPLHSSEPGKQPDFFTTLSMNGLTQELASALTSLDGLTGDFPEELEETDS